MLLQFPYPIILASASPRRKELMTLAGFDFTIRTSSADEDTSLSDPAAVVRELSLRKARAVSDAEPEAIVIGADTIVSLDNQILGKPTDEEDAFRMLSLLSGRTHQVYTGVALLSPAGNRRFEVCTHVTMCAHTSAFLRAYIRTGEPMDKAGAYGIQGKGALLIDRIEGDYSNVVGLPVARLYRQLMELFPG